MARHSSEQNTGSSSNRSQQHVKQHLPSASVSRSQRNPERQPNASLRAKFGANASQLKLTVYIIFTVALVLISIAFFSTNWLEAERRYYGSKFKKLGLWRMCFNSYSAPDDYQFKKFYVGCRWIFAEEYRPIRKFLLPSTCVFVIYVIQLYLIKTTNFYISSPCFKLNESYLKQQHSS